MFLASTYVNEKSQSQGLYRCIRTMVQLVARDKSFNVSQKRGQSEGKQINYTQDNSFFSRIKEELSWPNEDDSL